MPKIPVLADLIEDYEQRPEANPPCLKFMKPRYLAYDHQKSLSVSFPVLDMYLNPMGTMQGGLITAAFDNAFGALAHYSTGGRFMATIDIDTRFHYPIRKEDVLTVTVHILSLGKTLVSLRGEARDRKGQTVATATTSLMLLD